MEGSWVRCLQHKPVCQRRVDGQAALPVLLLGVMTGWKTTSSCLFVLLSFCMKTTALKYQLSMLPPVFRNTNSYAK